jgi:hypothetical protein
VPFGASEWRIELGEPVRQEAALPESTRVVWHRDTSPGVRQLASEIQSRARWLWEARDRHLCTYVLAGHADAGREFGVVDLTAVTQAVAHENAHCLSAANTVVGRVHSNAMPVILTTEQERCVHRGHSKGAVAYDPLGSSAVMQTRKKATASTGTFGLSTKLRSCGLPYSGGDLMSTHLSRNGLRRCLIGAVSFLIVTMVALFGIAQHFAV